MCEFATLNNEAKFIIEKNEYFKQNYILCDFKCENKIIEFDGEYWHKNSIEKDKNRDNYLLTKGFKTLRISDNEYINDEEKIVNKCINFLMD